MGTFEAHLRLNARCQPGNSTFTLQKTTQFTARRSDTAGNVLETKTFTSLPGVSQFHDSIGYYPGLRYRPANDGLYFWDGAASLAVPATGPYTTKITDVNKNPLYELYGVNPYGDSILGSGNPGDSGVQYGLHLAVVDKAKDGKWGMIKVWNSPAVLDLTMRVSPTTVRAGKTLTYVLKIVNTTPVYQSYEINNPIPENTTYVKSWHHDHQSGDNLQWKGKIAPYGREYIVFNVKVNKGTPKGTIIINQAYLTDGALGDSASVEATVK